MPPCSTKDHAAADVTAHQQLYMHAREPTENFRTREQTLFTFYGPPSPSTDYLHSIIFPLYETTLSLNIKLSFTDSYHLYGSLFGKKTSVA